MNWKDVKHEFKVLIAVTEVTKNTLLKCYP